MLTLSLGIILAGGGTNPAAALTITGSACTQQANNSLRFDCTITTDVAANAWIRFDDAAISGGYDTFRSTPAAIGGTNHTVTMYGMKASTSYEWVAYASAGGSTVNTGCHAKTSGALPGTGDSEANLTMFTAATATPGSPQVNNVATHWGCWDRNVGGGSVKRDDLVILDRAGHVVWYEDPSADLGYDTTANMMLEAISLSRPDHHILTIMNHEIILEYDLSGTLLTLLCRDDGSGYCPGTSTVPDAFFADYVHHDVQRNGGMIWALSAKDVAVDDVLDCDADLDTTEDHPIVVDGLYGFNTTGAYVFQSEDWDWQDVTTVDYTVATSCSSSGYWSGMLLGNDYMHTNSFWLDVADQWMFSRHELDDVVSVDSTATPQVIAWELGGASGGDFTQVAGGLSEVFDGQHHAHWGPTGDLVMFDNEPSGTSPRGVVFDLDVGAMTVDAMEQFTMTRSGGGAMDCQVGGSAVQLLSGNLLATCPMWNNTSGEFNEFSATDTAVWKMDLGCDLASGYYPSSLAFRAYPLAW